MVYLISPGTIFANILLLHSVAITRRIDAFLLIVKLSKNKFHLVSHAGGKYKQYDKTSFLKKAGIFAEDIVEVYVAGK
jgi:hypothetical protein